MRRASSFAVFGFAVVASLSLAQQARAVQSLGINLVQNPGFEDSTDDGSGGATTTPDWTVSAGFGTDFVDAGEGQTQTGGSANTGNWYAEFMATSAANAQSGTLSQMIATTPDQYYTVTFALANFGGPHDTFLATFGGQTLVSLTDSAAFGYKQFTAIVRVTTASTKLAFIGEQDPASFGLDDVDVEAGPAPVMGGGLVSLGMAAAGFLMRRLRRNARSA